MRKIPKYSELQLQIILDSTATLPDNISESVYENELRDNSRLKWNINPFLAKKQNLILFLDSTKIKKWIILKNLNWVIAVFIIVCSLLTNDYKHLWTLLIFPLFMASGLLDHWIMLFNLAILLGLKFFIGFNNHYFWFTLSIILTTYLLSKVTQEFLEKSIFKIAFSDSNTFWKYYSNRLIYVDETKVNNEFQNLAMKYPELSN
jgi:hypothetical protein